MDIGGYIEFEKYNGPMLHDNGIKLNCGRNAFAYLIEAKNITKITMPKFMCNSCESVLQEYNVSIRYYSINTDFKPIKLDLEEDEWLYLVNFYGQLSEEYIKNIAAKYRRVIVDNAQGYFQKPIEGIDTLYTCRKFFGVADGAILYTDKLLDRELLQDESFERMHFLMGRYERTASEFYSEYVDNNSFFATQTIKTMSKLTENLLHSIDYNEVKYKRKENFIFLHEQLESMNKLNLLIPEGPFMYPLHVENGAEYRTELQKQKIYIPMLWPAVLTRSTESDVEYDMAKNILPLPIDQRYGIEEMKYIINKIKQL